MVWFNSHDFECFWSVAFVSLAIPHLLIPGLCALLQWEMSWGAKSLLTASDKSAGNMFNLSLQKKKIKEIFSESIRL